MSQHAFQYKRIDLATDAIRLVRLLKGYPADPLKCELFETYLHEVEGVPYEALSYTWGEHTATEVIILNHLEMRVTRNLYEALCSLRVPNRDRLLWVDAICIDQEHKAEKGHQVGQMRLIYKNAENVLIWLGQGNDDIGSLMSLMNALDKRVTARSDYRRNSLEPWKAEWQAIEKEFDHLIKRCEFGLLQIFQSPWFRRVWVIQEVASARSATIVCGKMCVPTRAFVTMPALLGRGSELPPAVEPILDILPGHLRKASWWNETRDIYTLLKKFSHSEASNERDRLYALYGIASDLYDGIILPTDYEIPMQEALQNLISYILFKELLGDSVHMLPRWDVDEFFNNFNHLFSNVLRWLCSGGPDFHPLSIKLARCHRNFEVCNEDGNPPVIYLANLECPEFVFKTFLDINATESIRNTALILAAEAGCLSNFRALLRSGANINYKNTNGETSLIVAARNGQKSIVNHLLASVDLEVYHKDSTGRTALESAEDRGHQDIVELLLNHHSLRVNDKDLKGRTPLILAAIHDFTSTVRYLIHHTDVELNHKDILGLTALGSAVKHKSYDTLELLLACEGIEVNSRDLKGATALVLAAKEDDVTAAKDLLSHPNVDVNFPDNDGKTALLLAAYKRNYEMVDLILARQDLAIVLESQADSGSETESLLRIKRDQEQVAVLLREREIGLAVSASKGYTNIIKLSIQHGHLTYKNFSIGSRMLSSAAETGQLEIVRLLLEGDAEFQTAKDLLKTPMRLAIRNGHREIVQLLESYDTNTERIQNGVS